MFVFPIPFQVSQPSGTDQVDFTAYQALMEEVLVWLLAAEDHLDTSSSLQDDLSNLKEQFHKHEVNWTGLFHSTEVYI